MRAKNLIVSACSSMLLLAFSASADPPAAPATSAPAPAVTKIDPKAKGSNPYNAKLQKGIAAYGAKDYQGAIAAYKDAIAADANDPLAFYFLGEAQLAAGSMAEADSSYAKALSLVGNKDDLHAKILFVIADLRERQGKWPDAKKAWDDYSQFLTAHPTAKGYATTATERNKVIDTHVDLEAKYSEVKKRIEQRLKETTAPPPDDGPQGPAKKK
jgi:tetratricopeptide (TPR) repeat protein